MFDDQVRVFFDLIELARKADSLKQRGLDRAGNEVCRSGKGVSVRTSPKAHCQYSGEPPSPSFSREGPVS